MKNLFTTLLVLSILGGVHAQQSPKLDLRIGMGSSFLGTGDIRTSMMENELNYTFNNYLTISGSLAYAKGGFGGLYASSATFLQSNANVFISPFKNSKQNDFRLGTGVSYYDVSHAYTAATFLIDGELQEVNYKLENRTSIGLNIIVENSYAITDKFIIGLKLFTQPYKNGDINSGVLLKFGINL